MALIRKYDEVNDRLLLDPRYLLAYSKDDGFSYRGLVSEFLLTFDYRYSLTVNINYKTEIYSITDEVAPPGIISMLEGLLLHTDYLSLKRHYDYGDVHISGVGGQDILINFEPVTTRISIIDGLTEKSFVTDAEKELYKFNQYMKNWIESLYELHKPKDGFKPHKTKNI